MNVRKRITRNGKEILELQYGTSEWSRAKETRCQWCDKPMVTRVAKPNKTCGKPECRYSVMSKNISRKAIYKKCPFCGFESKTTVAAVRNGTFKNCGGAQCVRKSQILAIDAVHKRKGIGKYAPHGNNRYWNGCRCDICKEAHAKYNYKYIKRTARKGENRGSGKGNSKYDHTRAISSLLSRAK